MMRPTVGIAALALLLAACTVDDEGDATSGADGGPTSTVELSSSAPGVTPDAIKLGILVVDVDALAAVGVNLDPGNRQAQWQAAIDTANEAGGVNGRMIEPVYETVSPIGNAESDAACIALTEDYPVFMVSGLMIRDQPLCYTEGHDTSVVTLQPATREVVTASTAPLRSYRATSTNQNESFVTAAVAAGAIEEGDRVGVIEAQNDDEGFAATVDALKAAGFDVVEGPIDTPSGDELALRAAQDTLLERFSVEGVDVVVNQGLALFPLAQAEKGGYDFPFVLSQYIDPARFAEEGISAEASDGVFALADSLIGTTGQPDLLDDPAVADCVDAYEATDGSEEVVTDPSSTSTNLNGVIESCNVVKVFVEGATAAGDDLTNATFSAGLDGLGEIELAGLPFASLGAGKVSISDTAVPVRFDAEAAEWAPEGDIVDTEA